MTTAVMTDEFKYNFPLSNQTLDFVNFIGSKVTEFGNKLGIVTQTREIAKSYGKDIRTVCRYLKELEEHNIIDTASKRGRNGGMVIMFSDNVFDFEPTDNPITGEQVTPEQVRDMFFPNKPKKEPKKKYRSKAQIAEERILKQKRQAETDRLNDILINLEYPTEEFWKMTDRPVLNYRAYLISRMYNFYAVYYPIMRMNRYEAEGNRLMFKLAESYKASYDVYDVLPGKFMGTQNFHHFRKLALLCEEQNINPAEYLTVQFDYMEYLISHSAKHVTLPYVNTLVTVPAVKRWIDTYEYKKGFNKKHPYYHVGTTEVQTAGLRTPIMMELTRAFEQPFVKTENAYQEQIDVNVDVFMNPMLKTIWGYSEKTKKEIRESEELSPLEKQELSKFITQETSVRMSHNQMLNLALYASMNQMAALRKRAWNKEISWREYYHTVGNTGLEFYNNPLDIATNVKRGYLMDVSLFGAYQFSNTIKMLKHMRGFDVDYNVVMEAINKFGERKVPLTKEGFLDVVSIRRSLLPQEVIDEEIAYATPVIKNKEEEVYFQGDMWYDVHESTIGESKRDGKDVYGTCL